MMVTGQVITSQYFRISFNNQTNRGDIKYIYNMIKKYRPLENFLLFRSQFKIKQKCFLNKLKYVSEATAFLINYDLSCLTLFSMFY